MNKMNPTIESPEAKEALVFEIEIRLESLGKVVADSFYDKDGNLNEAPTPEIDEETLNLRWQEISHLLQQAFREELSQTQWAFILDQAVDYNYAPTRFRTHIGRVLRSVQAIIDGRPPLVTGRQAGVAEIELDDAPVRRELLTLLESKASSKKLNRARQDFFKKLRSDGYSGLRLVKLVHSCSHGEVVANSTDEDLGKIITDLYKKSDPSEQVVIVDFLRDQFTARNLRGAIKNKLMAFNVDGYHPFAFIEQGVRDANTLNVIADVNAGRIRPLQPPAGKRRTKRR